MRRLAIAGLLAALLAVACAPVLAEGVPIWQRWLRWASGETSETTVPTEMMGKHMQMSVRLQPLPGDEARAEAILAAAKRVLRRYRDVADAERDGYRPFAPRGVLGEEVHYTNYWVAGREARQLDLDRPGSILYKRTASGMQAVGVMYTARGDATPTQLDERVPLSIGVWHRHVHFCGWPSGAPKHDYDGPGARFGFAGSIDSEAGCAAAGGYWVPVAFGWMTHVYPFERERDKIWIGEHMLGAHAAEPAAPPEQGGRAVKGAHHH